MSCRDEDFRARIIEARDAVLGVLPTLDRAGDVWREAGDAAFAALGSGDIHAVDGFLADVGAGELFEAMDSVVGLIDHKVWTLK